MNQDNINTEPDPEQEARAIAYIRNVVKAATGQEIPEAKAKELFAKAKERLIDSMAKAEVEQP